MSTIKGLINLQGRCAIITGAAGHLGRVFSETLAELGANLILLDKTDSDLESIEAKLINEWGVLVESKFCDLENSKQRSDFIYEMRNSNRRLDILVNNAALGGSSNLPGWSVSIEHQSIDTWRRAFEVNLTAVFDLSKGLLPLLEATQRGSIVNIASIYGLYGPDWKLYEDTNLSNPAAYSASKGGLIQLTRWLATTIAPRVRVNAIAPGGVFRDQPPNFVSNYVARTPLARMATEDDMRGAIAYLASDLSSYVTGQILSVDGGWGAW